MPKLLSVFGKVVLVLGLQTAPFANFKLEFRFRAQSEALWGTVDCRGFRQFVPSQQGVLTVAATMSSAQIQYEPF